MNQHEQAEREEDLPKPLPFAAAKIQELVRNGFPIKTGSSPSIELRRDHEACRHKQIVIDAAARIVQCETCGASLDAFDALLTLARHERDVHREYAAIQKEREMQRGFYAFQKTVRADSCRHTRTWPIPGGKKCARCNQVFADEPARAVAGGAS